MLRISVRALAAMTLVVSLVGCATTSRSSGEPGPPVVFLVRHAEKVDGSRDAALSDAGRVRAQRLAEVLRDAGVEHVHSTDYARTRDTARPLADALGVEIRLYDPRDLEGLAELLRREGGRHLVVGHSNTTPALVSLLGGQPGEPIVEATEYDRLYCQTWSRSGEAITVLWRYGAR